MSVEKKQGKRKRSRSPTLSRSCSASQKSSSTSSSVERAKHYPAFRESYCDKYHDRRSNSGASHFNAAEAVSPDAAPFLASAADGKLILYGRFVFVRELGKGTYSKVALVEDPQQHARLALKIFRAEKNYDEAFEDERDILRMLTEASETTGPWRRRFTSPLFTIRHRLHCAIAFPLLGGTLLDLLEARKGFWKAMEQATVGAAPLSPNLKEGGLPMHFVRSVAFQLLSLAATLEVNCIVHTDIKPENILLEDREPLLVDPEYGPLPVTSAIQVIDFGSAQCISQKSVASKLLSHESKLRYSTIQTRHYRAPEVIFRSGWDAASDVWSIALVLLELHTGRCTFMTHEDAEHLAMMEKLLGRPPKESGGYAKVFLAGKAFRDFVSCRTEATGELRWPRLTQNSAPVDTRYLDDVQSLQQQTYGSDPQFFDLLQQLLKWDRRERLSPRAALEHRFFTNKPS